MAEHDDEWFRKYLDAGAALGQITRARAEAFVRELMGGHDQGDAKQRMEDFFERSRRASEELINVVRTEVANQLSALGLDAEHLGSQMADVLRRTAAGQRHGRKREGSTPPIPLGSGTWTAGEPGPGTTAPNTEKAAADRPRTTGPATRNEGGATAGAPAKKAAAKKAAPAKKAPAAKKAAAANKAVAKKGAPAKKAAAKTATPAKKAPVAKKAAAGPPSPEAG